jgi:hypothetical protein
MAAWYIHKNEKDGALLLWDRAAATVEHRQRLNLGRKRLAA